ncbi:MAG TPA: polymer-forming cytoskeletal protein [Candidatus Dormibacteraeota bacterium]|nr:polymer-forming cytoskeletal protein [Candidatus Dormibacteraeota bacterium]
MPKKHDLLGVTETDTIIGANVRLKGNLASEGDILIDGHLEGNVKSARDVTIGVNAQIAGDVAGQNITIAGQQKGDIQATEGATITATGQVAGDITASLLSIERGGIFIGNSKMKPAQTQTEATNKEPAED